MARSEHGIYEMVRSALARAEKHGFDVRWTPDGWTAEQGKISVRGSTATELHQYLNGYEDGRVSGLAISAQEIRETIEWWNRRGLTVTPENIQRSVDRLVWIMGGHKERNDD